MILHGGRDAQLPKAHRCPNPAACPGRRAMAITSADQGVGPERMCQHGYDAASPGCARCADGFGRSEGDPFVCSECPHERSWGWWASASVVLGKNVMLLALGLNAATPHASECKAIEMLINGFQKIFLSFGELAALAVQAVPRSPKFQTSLDWVKSYYHSVMQIQAAGGSGGLELPAVSTSLDCLWMEHVGLDDKTMLVVIVSVGLLLLALLWAAVGWLCGGLKDGGWRLLRTLLVWQNTFYPTLVASFAAYLPCVATSESEWRLAYAADIECPQGLPPTWAVGIACKGLGLLILTGPAFWWFVLLQTKITDRKKHLGFLVAEYSENCHWWEAFVLSRKMCLRFIGAKIPASYAPQRFTLWMLIVVNAAGLLHWAYRTNCEDALAGEQGKPEGDKGKVQAQMELARAEGKALVASATALSLALAALTTWWQESMWWFNAFVVAIGACLSFTTLYLLAKLFLAKFFPSFVQKSLFESAWEVPEEFAPLNVDEERQTLPSLIRPLGTKLIASGTLPSARCITPRWVAQGTL